MNDGYIINNIASSRSSLVCGSLKKNCHPISSLSTCSSHLHTEDLKQDHPLMNARINQDKMYSKLELDSVIINWLWT